MWLHPKLWIYCGAETACQCMSVDFCAFLHTDGPVLNVIVKWNLVKILCSTWRHSSLRIYWNGIFVKKVYEISKRKNPTNTLKQGGDISTQRTHFLTKRQTYNSRSIHTVKLFSPHNRKKWVHNELLNFSVHPKVEWIKSVRVHSHMWLIRRELLRELFT